MPKIRPGMGKPPKGFDKISAGLDEYETAMRDAIAEPADGKKKNQLNWGVSKINTHRTRFVYDVFRRGEIDQRVVDFCVANGFIDGTLIKLWGVAGYETACCTQCVDSRQSTFGGSCVCRVPAKDRKQASGPCARCGCTGCSSVDVAAAKREQEKAEQNENNDNDDNNNSGRNNDDNDDDDDDDASTKKENEE